VITTRRSLLASLGFALPLVAAATGASASTTSLPHHAAKHAHSAHAQRHVHGKMHRTASVQRLHPKHA
jgi:hypothetical protein